MNKINNKLILILGIIAFIFGLSLASPAYAVSSIMDSGTVIFPPNYGVQVSNAPVVIAGCEGRNTGFSSTTGQSCVGNYVNNTNTNNNSSSTTSNTTTKNSNTTNTTNTTVSKTTDTGNAVAANNTTANDSYGGLTANALEGSDSFLPTGLLQWIFLAIIVVAIIFLWRYVFRSEDTYLSEPLKHA